jgi:ribosome-associated protein
LATPKLTAIVIDALEDIKARDIKLINVTKLTSVFDHIAIASADSTRQTKALAKNVMDKVRSHGHAIHGSEGEQSGEWVLVDCGDVVVHIMQPAVREYYKLEELWAEGKVEFPAPKRAPRAKPASTATEEDGAPAAKPKVVRKKGATAKKPAAKKPAAKKPAAAKPAAGKKTAKTTAAVADKVKSTTKVAAKATVATRAKTATKSTSAEPAAKKTATRRKTTAS